jgi:hypothetical protein
MTVVLFCCCILIEVNKNIPVQGVMAGSPKATCNFSCLHFQVFVGIRYQSVLILRNALLRRYSAITNAFFFSVVVSQWCHEFFV